MESGTHHSLMTMDKVSTSVRGMFHLKIDLRCDLA
jgi:hypothetical protein